MYRRFVHRSTKVCLTACCLITGGWAAYLQARPTAPPSAPGVPPRVLTRYAADLTFRHRLVDSSGPQTAQPAREVSYRFERLRTGGRWRTTMTLRRADRIDVRSAGGTNTLTNAFAPVRIEDDGDGPIMYDARGRILPQPGARDRRLFRLPDAARRPSDAFDAALGRVMSGDARRGLEWDDAPVARSDRRGERRGAFERQFGRVAGRVNGFDRYLRADGDTTQEVLVDAVDQVPIEINAVRHGTLLSHSTIAHDRRSDGTLIRRAVRTERALEATKGQRALTEIEFANVTFAEGGR